MAKASHRGMGEKRGSQSVGPSDPDTSLDIDDLAGDIKGRNSLQGNDQGRVHNERVEVAGVKRKTEGVIESFENMDPKTRAGKG